MLTFSVISLLINVEAKKRDVKRSYHFKKYQSMSSHESRRSRKGQSSNYGIAKF